MQLFENMKRRKMILEDLISSILLQYLKVYHFINYPQ